jgi:hypothetical protein
MTQVDALYSLLLQLLSTGYESTPSKTSAITYNIMTQKPETILNVSSKHLAVPNMRNKCDLVSMVHCAMMCDLPQTYLKALQPSSC